MSTGNELAVRTDPDAMASHAELLDRASAGVNQAGEAGQSIIVGADAYGILCSFLPKLLGPAQLQAADALAAVATGLRAAAATVREGAMEYRRTDEQTAAAYRQAGGG